MKWGFGTAVYLNKAHYEGHFFMDKRHGFGKMRYSNAGTYEVSQPVSQCLVRFDFPTSIGGMSSLVQCAVRVGHNDLRKRTTTALLSHRYSFVWKFCHCRGSLFAVFAGDRLSLSSIVCSIPAYRGRLRFNRVNIALCCTFMLTPLHCTCQGEWASGKPHGQGTATHKDGEKYVGTYKAGLYHGEGEYYPLSTTPCRTRGTALAVCRNILCNLFSLSLEFLIRNVGRVFASYCVLLAVSTLLLLYDMPSRTFLPSSLWPSDQGTPQNVVLACFHQSVG